MSLKQMREVCEFLGPMYSIQKRDEVESICRIFADASKTFEFEVTGFFGTKSMTVNLWQLEPYRILLAIYSGITSKEALSDTLGYIAFKYQNLQEKIQVEREDPAQ